MSMSASNALAPRVFKALTPASNALAPARVPVLTTQGVNRSMIVLAPCARDEGAGVPHPCGGQAAANTPPTRH
jgi:hypothetical protein